MRRRQGVAVAPSPSFVRCVRIEGGNSECGNWLCWDGVTDYYRVDDPLMRRSVVKAARVRGSDPGIEVAASVLKLLDAGGQVIGMDDLVSALSAFIDRCWMSSRNNMICVGRDVEFAVYDAGGNANLLMLPRSAVRTMRSECVPRVELEIAAFLGTSRQRTAVFYLRSVPRPDALLKAVELFAGGEAV